MSRMSPRGSGWRGFLNDAHEVTRCLFAIGASAWAIWLAVTGHPFSEYWMPLALSTALTEPFRPKDIS